MERAEKVGLKKFCFVGLKTILHIKIVQNAILNLTKNKTTLVIAHRLSTIHNADKIFVLKNGKIIDSGKHDALINKCDEYKSLYEKQLKKS